MGTLQQRREGLKTAWRDLSERARRGEAFGHIGAAAILYSAGYFPDRESMLEFLYRGATAEDLKAYRRVHQKDPLEFKGEIECLNQPLQSQ